MAAFNVIQHCCPPVADSIVWLPASHAAPAMRLEMLKVFAARLNWKRCC
jgi:hypothetical protein